MDMEKNLEKIAERYKSELFDSIVPFWEKHCIDAEYGGYFTMLDRDGSVYDTEKYMWMQWRIVYMFAELAVSENNAKWLEIAIRGFDFLTKNGKAEDGSYYFVLSRDGKPAVAPYNVFSESFAAMGAAALFKATGEEQYRSEANSSMANYLKRVNASGAAKGQWEKEMPGRPSRFSLGHYMILANLGQVLKENLQTSEYDGNVNNAIETVLKDFYNPELDLLFENVNINGDFDLDSSLGRHIIPGHGLEAMWFIMQHAEKQNNQIVLLKAVEITKSLLEFGWDKDKGGIYYFMDALGKPHFELQWNMKLWWVHNEATIAALYAYTMSQDACFLEWFKKVEQWAWQHFRDEEYGEWFGYLNYDGSVASCLKGGRWKTFFHLPRALNIINKLLIRASENLT